MNRTTEEKVALVREYLESGKTQAQFCEERGDLSPRTLRNWLQTYTRPADTLGRAREVVARAIGELQAILQGLKAAGSCHEAEPAFEEEDAPAGAPCQEAEGGDQEQLEQEDDALHQGPNHDGSEAASPKEPPAPEPPLPVSFRGANPRWRV